jgi:lycopene cyclase domain-containing protein
MKGLYLLLDGATVLFPILLSFDKKVAFVKQWKAALLSGLIVALPFLVWDIAFTQNGFWGFNPDYLVGLYIYNLPIEEVLFFLLVPFSCLFIYACVKAYLQRMSLYWTNAIIYFLLLCYIGFIVLYSFGGAYPRSVIASSVMTLMALLFSRERTRFLPLAFVISLLPFLLVNGVLTGGFTEEPVVWYNDAERVPFRIFTIPAEDILYCFTLIGMNAVIFEVASRRLRR